MCFIDLGVVASKADLSLRTDEGDLSVMEQ